MKRIILSLVFVLAFGQVAMAQDIDKLIAELAQVEGVEHQIVDRSMLDAMQAEVSEEDASKIPRFMKKLELLEVVAAENVQPELKNRFLEELNTLEDGNGYETLLTVKDGEDNVRIVVQRQNGEVSAVIVFAIDDEDAAIVKMVGKFDQSDLTDILEQQEKNRNK